MKKTKVLTVMVCATMLTASGSAMAAYAEEASAPAFGFNQGGAPGEQMEFMGGQNPPMGQPAEDDSRVIAKVTGIDGNMLTVEKLTPGEAGQQSSETITYDISGITVGEDIKKDSMIEIILGEDGNVSSVSAGRNMPAEGPGMRMQIPGNGPASQIIEYFN